MAVLSSRSWAHSNLCSVPVQYIHGILLNTNDSVALTNSLTRFNRLAPVTSPTFFREIESNILVDPPARNIHARPSVPNTQVADTHQAGFRESPNRIAGVGVSVANTVPHCPGELAVALLVHLMNELDAPEHVGAATCARDGDSNEANRPLNWTWPHAASKA